MDTTQEYVESAHRCAALGTGAGNNPELEAYWQREAQIQATLALVAAVWEVRNVLIARLPS